MNTCFKTLASIFVLGLVVVNAYGQQQTNSPSERSTSEELIERRIWQALHEPKTVLDLAGLCNEKEFVIAPVCAVMLDGDEQCVARAIEILRPHFRAPKLFSIFAAGHADVPKEFEKIEGIGRYMSFSFTRRQQEVLEAVERLEVTPEARYFRILVKLLVVDAAYQVMRYDLDSDKFSVSQLQNLDQVLLAARSEFEEVDKEELLEIDEPLSKTVKECLDRAESNRDHYRNRIQLVESGLSFQLSENNPHYSWEAKLGSQTYTRPATGQGKVFIGTNNGAGYRKGIPSEQDKGVLLCFDDNEGKFLWQLTRDKLKRDVSTTGLFKES